MIMASQRMGSLTQSAIVILCASLIFHIPTIYCFIIDSEGQDASAIDIDIQVFLDTYQYSANVSENKGDLVSGAGLVIVDTSGPGSQTQDVHVEIYAGVGGRSWNSTVTPSTIDFAPGGGSGQFNFTILLPSGVETELNWITIMTYAEMASGATSNVVDIECELSVFGVEPYTPDGGKWITTNGGRKETLRLDGEYFVWSDDIPVPDPRGNISGQDNDVYLGDINTGKYWMLINDTQNRGDLDISGNYIVWVVNTTEYTEENDWGIPYVLNLYDINKGESIIINFSSDPGVSGFISQIEGDYIALSAYEYNPAYRYLPWDMDAYGVRISDLSSEQYSGQEPIPVTDEMFVVTDGEYLVFCSRPTSGVGTTMTVVDLASGNSDSFDVSDTIWGPIDMDDGIVTFVDDLGGGNSELDVVYYDVVSGSFNTIEMAGEAQIPRIDEGRIVWSNYNPESKSNDLYLYIISSGDVNQISSHWGDEENPDISGSDVICFRDRNNVTDIVYYDIEYILSNNAPVISDMTAEKEVVFPKDSIDIQVEASDTDGDELIYEYEVTGGEITGEGAEISWTAPEDEGIYIITCRVSDGITTSAPGNISILVDREVQTGHKPVIDDISAQPEEVRPGGTTTISVTTHDDDDDVLSYLYESEYGTFSSEGELTDKDSDTWTAPDDEGTYTLQVRAYDGLEYSTPALIDLKVSQDAKPDENRAPRISKIDYSPSIVKPGGSVSITVQASDPDGDELEYTFNSDAGSFSLQDNEAVWTAPELVDSYEISIEVSDPYGLVDKDSFYVLVDQINVAPKILYTQLSAESVPADDDSEVLLTVRIEDENGLSDIAEVSVDLSDFGLSRSQDLYDDGDNGDETAGDGIYFLTLSIPIGILPGEYELQVTVMDLAGESSVDHISLTVEDFFGGYNEDGSDSENVEGFLAIPAVIFLILIPFTGIQRNRIRR